MLNDSNLSKRYMAAEIRDKVNKIQTDNDGWIPVEERLPEVSRGQLEGCGSSAILGSGVAACIGSLE